jgi:2-dehydro-3-deoxygluconokinase
MQYGVQSSIMIQKLLPYCHVVMGNVWAAESLLDISSTIYSSDGKTKEELIEAAKKSMLQLHQQYKNVKQWHLYFVCKMNILQCYNMVDKWKYQKFLN